MFDLFIFIVLIWSFYSGWKNGLIRELTSSLGIFVGLFFALMFYSTLGEYLTVDGSQVNMFTSIFAFILLWIAVPFALGLVANMLTRFLKAVSLSPLICALGALLSFVKFSILIGCILLAMREIRILNEAQLQKSRSYPLLAWIASNSVRLLTTELDTSFYNNHKEDKEQQETPDTIWVER